MVKKIKRRVVTGARVHALYARLITAMRDESNFGRIFERFMDLVEYKPIGTPTADPFWPQMLAIVGQQGLGGHVLSSPPEVAAFESTDPALVHGAARFGSKQVTFFYLPPAERGIAALAAGGMMHYQRFSPTVLPPGTQPVLGNDTMH